VVELRDANKAPLALAGLTVVFKANNATVSAANVVTDANGRASTTVTLGAKPGDMTVSVIVGSLPVVTARFTVAGPVLSSQSVTHSATAAVGPICAGLLVTIYGSNIGPANLLVNSGGPDGKYSTSLGDTRVLFDGVPGAIVYVSATQTSAIVPYNVSGKASVQVVVEYQGVASNPVTVAVASSQPGLFAADSSGSGQGAIRNEDNSVNSKDNPIQRNHIVVLYGTGGGDTDPPGVDGLLANDVYPKMTLPVKVLINGAEAEMPYAGAAPTLVAGVFQINVRIPAGTPDGNATVQVFVGDNKSPATITVAVKGD
jgi:uncharacterized protein (TIGR03437 family)